MYAFFWHLIFFMFLGPLTALPLAIVERSFVLGKNMAFQPTCELNPVYMFQVFLWCLWFFPLSLVVYKKITLDVDWMELHNGDFDLVALLFVGLQVFFRAIIISMKYGTITEQHMRHTRTNPFTLAELQAGLTVLGWL
jgi:hypothetical protein